MKSIELAAPAKVNLFLKVLNRRKDSYHNILTLFERISLCDTIRITKARRGVTVVSNRPITLRVCDNIAYKAARLILDYGKVDGGVSIHINKRIPLASGLGGGSSDAAAVLSGINRLYNLDVDKGVLMRLGASLGADVPFFLFDTPFAIGRSAGDRLIEADIRMRPWHLLVYPGPFKVSAGDVYADFDALKRLSKNLTSRPGGVRITLPKDWNGLESMLYNDLGDVVAKKRPVIGKIIQCLVASLGRNTIVSGSGPSVFCLYRSRKEALEGKRVLYESVPAGRRRLWQVFVVRTKV